jgi:hypothetical protein
MGKAKRRRDVHRWERIREIMRDSVDPSRLAESPGRAWPAAARAVIRAILDVGSKWPGVRDPLTR